MNHQSKHSNKDSEQTTKRKQINIYNHINRRARLNSMMLNEQNHRMLKWRRPPHHYIDFDAIKANRKLKRNKNILLSRVPNLPNLYWSFGIFG